MVKAVPKAQLFTVYIVKLKYIYIVLIKLIGTTMEVMMRYGQIRQYDIANGEGLHPYL